MAIKEVAIVAVIAVVLIIVGLTISTVHLATVGQSLTGKIVLKPCPLDSSVNAYALETTDGTVYYLIAGEDMYLIENAPELKPWLREHLGKTVALRGEIVTLNGSLSLRSPEEMIR